MFIIPLIVSIVALFKINDNKSMIIILEAIILLIGFIYALIESLLYLKEYINARMNKNKIDYESLRDELYNILPSNDLKQNLYSKIKDLLF